MGDEPPTHASMTGKWVIGMQSEKSATVICDKWARGISAQGRLDLQADV